MAVSAGLRRRRRACRRVSSCARPAAVLLPRHAPAGGDARSPGFPADENTGIGVVNSAPVFKSGRVNVQPNNYWSGTEYAPNTSNAWNFNFNNGNQNNNNKTNGFYAWAVRPGG
ncbi:MAG: DUF1566 domain-containing protein [Gammaproteobacteria bacterium]|nr:DUF1566 domain-containing protein [Gammaproteobacteria bacterium]